MKELETIFIEYKKLIANFNLSLNEFNNYAIIHHSSSIEGNTLTLGETEVLLKLSLTPKSKPLNDSLMVVDHYKALKYILELSKNNKLITLANLQNTAALIMQSTGKQHYTILGNVDESKGDIRVFNVRAGNGYTYMNYDKVEFHINKLLEALTIKLNNNYSFVAANKIAFEIHYQLLTIHPFADGNGRTARLMMNYVQNWYKIPLSFIYNNDKQKYYTALEETRKKEDIDIFHNFMFNQLKKQLSSQIKLIKTPKKAIKKNKGFSLLF